MSSRSFHRPSADGNRRHVDEREVVNGLMYVLSTGSNGAPFRRTCRRVRRFTITSIAGVGTARRSRPRRALREVSRSRRSRGEPDRRDHRQPERQERGKRGTCIDPAGYDADKKIMGKKRHILVDTQGLLMHAIVHAADIQDRDGGAALMATLFGASCDLTRLFADGGYRGPQFQTAVCGTLTPLGVGSSIDRSGQGLRRPAQALVGERTFPGSAAADGWPRTGNASTRKALAFPPPRLHPPHAARKLCNPT